MVFELKKPGLIGMVVTSGFTLALGIPSLSVTTTSQREPTEPLSERTLSFPVDKSVGSVWIRARDSDNEEDWEFLSDAKGELGIPIESQTLVKVVRRREENLDFLSSLNPNDVQGLDLDGTNATDSDMERVARFTGLRKLNLAGTRITNEGMAHLSGLTQLTWLGLERTKIDSEGIAEIADLVGLKRLDVYNAPIGDQGLEEIQGLVNLKELGIEKTAITHQGLNHLSGMTSLEWLNLEANDLSGPGLAALCNLPELKTLNLQNTGLTDDDLAHLVGLQAVAELSLTDNPVTDVGIARLSHLTTLVKLTIFGTGITEQGLALLTKSPIRATPSSDAPKVGVLFSHYTATGPSWIGKPYGYGFANRLAESLLKLNLNVFAIVEPETENIGELPEQLERLGLGDRVLDGADSNELKTLDVIAAHTAYNMKDEVIDAIVEAVRGGTGFVNRCGLGLVSPGYNQSLKELLGLENPGYEWHGFTSALCPVVNEHEILGLIAPGNMFPIQTADGYNGIVEGTPLLGAPEGFDVSFSPLYVRELGTGRVVNIQWHSDPETTLIYTFEEFLVRCINWAAKKPVGAKWTASTEAPKG